MFNAWALLTIDTIESGLNTQSLSFKIGRELTKLWYFEYVDVSTLRGGTTYYGTSTITRPRVYLLGYMGYIR